MHAAVLWLPIALRRRSARFRDSPEGASRMPHSSSTCTDNDQLSAPFAAEAFRQIIGARRVANGLSWPQPIHTGRTTQAEDEKPNLTVVHLGA